MPHPSRFKIPRNHCATKLEQNIEGREVSHSKKLDHCHSTTLINSIS